MSSTSANANVSTTGGDDSAQEREGGEGGAGGEWDGRDPKTGEGIWVDDEDEVRSCVSCDTSSSTYSLGYDDRRAARAEKQCTRSSVPNGGLWRAAIRTGTSDSWLKHRWSIGSTCLLSGGRPAQRRAD